MKSGIWHLAGISLLCLNMSAQALAGDQPSRDMNRDNGRGEPNAAQQQQSERRQQQQQIQQQHDQQRGVERQQDQQIRDVDRQQQQQIQQQQNQQRQVERQQQQQIRDVDRQQQQQIQQQQMQQRQVDRQQQQQLQQQQIQQRQIEQRQQLQQRQNNLPIQSGPGEARQTQPPRQGYYQDNGPRNNRGDYRPNDHWTGRPDGHGNGWGGGPQYRPGYVTDRVPGSYSRVPYRGQDYFYSDGYWYRPQGPRYVVVTPPYGMRVRSLPSYSQEVWVGSALFFLAAGTYYTYQQDSQDYEVVYPPQNVEPAYTQQMPASSAYDPIAYPNNGQSQEQVAQDKYDCYRWSVEQSAFDPADPNSPNAPAMIQVYRRSMVACLMGRGYTIN